MTWTILPGLTDVSPTSVLWSVVTVLGTLIAARYAGRAVTRLGHRLPSVEDDQVLQASRVVRYVVLEVGDLVTSCGYTGRVTDLTSRTVVLESPDGSTIHLPNQRVMKDPLVNASTLGRVRSVLQVRVPVGSGDVVEDSEARLLDGAGTADGVLPHPAPDLLLVGVDTDRATFALRYWHALDATAEVGSRVARRIQRACGADGTEFALASPPPAPPIRPGAL